MRLGRKESLCNDSIGPEIQIEEFLGFAKVGVGGYLPATGFTNEIIKPETSEI
jgi:hypothetical protein